MLFSPPLFFCSQKVNDHLSTQITLFPLAYPVPTVQLPPSPTALSPSMSAKVHLLIEMIQSLKALLKERTPTPPSSLLSHPPQPLHPLPPLYHQADPLSPNPFVFPPTSYNKEMPSYLLLGWPLPPPPTMFALHWEQLKAAPSTFHQFCEIHSNSHSNPTIHKHG